MIEVDFAFLSDSAQVVDGKLYMVGGGIDVISTPKLPFKLPHLSLALRLLLSSSELKKIHNLKVNVIDEKGKNVSQVGGKIKVGPRMRSQSNKSKTSFLTVLDFWNLKFNSQGNVRFDIMVNNVPLKQVSLRVSQSTS